MSRLRIKLDFVVNFEGPVPAMHKDLCDAFEGAVRGLYPVSDFDATIEPGGKVSVTHMTRAVAKRQSSKT
jgi:hypothetical protein